MNMTTRAEHAAAATVADPRWARLAARDAAADGQFFYSVRTTGVYCRPSCGARLPRPENVAFHASAEAAERAGFRPCKRCRPDAQAPSAQQAAWVAEVCREIESADTPPTLAELAQRVGMSPWHLQRSFKAATGLSPKAWAVAARDRRMRDALGEGEGRGRVTDAIYEAGYGAPSRFYERADDSLGMTPKAWRAGGKGAEIHFAIGQCSLGSILVARSGRGICAITLGDDPDVLAADLQARFPQAALIGGDADFERVVAQVVGLIEVPRQGLDLPLDIRGTAFQQRVWQALRAIPAGNKASYAEIAERIGAPTSTRAVAQACAANPLAVAIPCHRVVRRDGGLSGYRWGVERKRTLLAREAASR